MAEIEEIDVAQAQELVASGNYTLLDVRELDEWEAGHAPDARFMPLGTLAATHFHPGQSVAVICRSGGRSAAATEKLLDAAVKAVNISGGMNAWAANGQPVVKDDGSPGSVI